MTMSLKESSIVTPITVAVPASVVKFSALFHFTFLCLSASFAGMNEPENLNRRRPTLAESFRIAPNEGKSRR
jgi:hypothetical protein